MARTIHGLARDPLFCAWKTMIARCHNPKSTSYPRYGARGISVCDRWRESFEAFRDDDMGPKPSPDHSVERKENEKGYEPTNCVWATIEEQTRNRRSNVLIEHGGRTMCLADWCSEYGVDYYRTRKRLKRGWSFERAFAD